MTPLLLDAFPGGHYGLAAALTAIAVLVLVWAFLPQRDTYEESTPAESPISQDDTLDLDEPLTPTVATDEEADLQETASLPPEPSAPVEEQRDEPVSDGRWVFRADEPFKPAPGPCPSVLSPAAGEEAVSVETQPAEPVITEAASDDILSFDDPAPEPDASEPDGPIGAPAPVGRGLGRLWKRKKLTREEAAAAALLREEADAEEEDLAQTAQALRTSVGSAEPLSVFEDADVTIAAPAASFGVDIPEALPPKLVLLEQ